LTDKIERPITGETYIEYDEETGEEYLVSVDTTTGWLTFNSSGSNLTFQGDFNSKKFGGLELKLFRCRQWYLD